MNIRMEVGPVKLIFVVVGGTPDLWELTGGYVLIIARIGLWIGKLILFETDRHGIDRYIIS